VDLEIARQGHLLPVSLKNQNLPMDEKKVPSKARY
jgi:hypothetical protein